MDSPSGLRQWIPWFQRPSVNPAFLFILLFPCWVLVSLGSSRGPEHRDFDLTVPSPNNPVTSAPFPLVANGKNVSTIRIDAVPPANTSYNMSLELLDAKGTLLLHADKEGWRETGSWYEDGYSGTYDESDRSFWLKFKPRESGNFSVRLSVDSLLSSQNQPVSASIPVSVRISSSSSNQGLLFLTLIVSFSLACMVLHLSYFQGRRRLKERSDDVMALSRKTRAVYPAGLMSLHVSCRFENTTSSFGPQNRYHLVPVHMKLSVIDAVGAVRNNCDLTGYLSKKQSEEDDSFDLKFPSVYYQLDQVENLRFRIDIPETVSDIAELEWFDLDLRDKVVVPWPVSTQKLS